MKSILKTSVQVNTHVDLIRSLIVDAYEISRSQFKGNQIPPDMILRQNAFYYRFLRQTGHNTAIKVMLQDQNLPHITAVFTQEKYMKEFVKTIETVQPRSEFSHSAVSMAGNSMRGVNPMPTEILIFSDLVSSEDTKLGWKWLNEVGPTIFPNLKQVVFLG